MRRLIAKIYGNVQNVGFRFSAKQRADDLGLKGFVRNELDGSVRVEAEGGEKFLEIFLDWCKKGPDAALIERIDFRFSDELTNFSDFRLEL